MSIDKNTRIIDLTVGEYLELQEETSKDLKQAVNLLKIAVDKHARPLTITEACEYLDITRPTFNKYRPYLKEVGGRSPRFLLSELLDLKSRLRNGYIQKVA